jgi:thiol-disulfide isomerase/thioredoxin
VKITFDRIITVVLLIIVAVYIGRYFYLQPKFINGEQAPDFSARLIDGRPFELSQLQGQYVLLDFWASWCAPCRRQNPDLVAFQRDYQDVRFRDAEGLEVVSVALESNPASWRAAIEKDGLDWPYHILDGNMGEARPESIGMQYQIRSIPASFLLDPTGKIIAVNANYRQLRRLLKSRRID